MADDIDIKVRASTDDFDAKIDQAKEKLGTLADAAKAGGAGMASLTAQTERLSTGAQKAARDALAADMAGFQNHIRLAALAYAADAENLNAAVRVGRKAEAEKTQALRDALSERFAQEQEYYQKELQLAGLSLAQRQRIQGSLAVSQQRYLKEMQRLDDQALQASVRSWQSALGTIQGAWDSQLKGLLSGTTTWAAAMRAIVQDLVIEIIKQFEKAALAKAALGMAGMGLDIGTGGIGGALFGGLTKLIGFDVGSWSVPQDMPAMVHSGEMIIPAPAAQQFRSVLSGGGVTGGGPAAGGAAPNLTFQVSAIDARSFANALSDSSSALYKLIQQGMRNGALKLG